jgi:maltooligosyltrehalose trehalohydrolase
MSRGDNGVHAAIVPGLLPGDRYFYSLETRVLPDPVSRLQPEGVHGPSAIVEPTDFPWTDTEWQGISLRDAITYELHVGTCTPAGTFGDHSIT